MGKSHLLSKSHCQPNSFPSGYSKSLAVNFPYLPSPCTQAYDSSTALLLSLHSESSVKEHGDLKNKEKLSGVTRCANAEVTGDAARM